MIYLYALLVLVQIIFSIGIIVFFISMVIADFTTDAPFVPIPRGIEDDIMRALALQEGNILYDLGCGDARVLIHAVNTHPNMKAFGVEKSLIPYLLARYKTQNTSQIHISFDDIFNVNVSSATHIFTYLSPQIEKLLPTLLTRCKPGTRIISCDFEAKNFIPTEIISLKEASDGRGKKLFIYTV